MAASATSGRLAFITCGSVDDGKSTLLGRLLHDAGALPTDRALPLTPEGEPDHAALIDGLMAEREQGITIDVAYRPFATPRRAFLAIDAPGHEQFTRNMVTGASNADVAVILVDAEKGLLPQTRRHSHLVALLGMKTVILAVTKMDRVGGAEAVFRPIVEAFAPFASELGIETVIAITVSGRTGDQVVGRGTLMPWYQGPTLLEALESLPVRGRDADAPFRMAVQGVVRLPEGGRAYSGRIASGTVRAGQGLRVLPSGRTATVEAVMDGEGQVAEGLPGRSVMIRLDTELDVARGDVLTAADAPLEVADQFEAHLVWMGEDPLLPGRIYDLKLGTRTVPVQISDIRHRVDVQTLAPLAARTLSMNDIGLVHLTLGREIAFAPYEDSPEFGGFILIDRQSFETVGAGMIRFALRRAHNIHRQALNVDRETRARLKGQKPAVLWLTGLSGAGKSTLANAVEARLTAMGHHAYLIDGDNLRHGLSRDLGFTDADRVENIRRAAETARMMADAGLIVLVSLISPFAAERQMARGLMVQGEFLEVFVDAPLEVVEARDVKGLYKKARAGELANFTGIDSPYEAPEAPELHICTDRQAIDAAADQVIAALKDAGRLRD
ncbi:MAG: adenylyl-sulfate kinase [Brevundimonas sp.]|uniref:adenylyl-sulfate kinase n=1 Tax=Brevundimonas sp. TaxID=1871086 RepID=UPI002736BE24|nr:adenylyl-sulfate kinase [Brevundimonas sp.]MDP3377355.1 adenylyl-sulfate kinase [Brevundimonas sp.]